MKKPGTPTTEKACFSKNKVEVRSSAVHGLGVFATENISPEEIIEECPVIVLEDSGCVYPKEILNRRFDWDKNKSSIALGYGSLYNHAENSCANFRIDTKNKLIKIFAAKPIFAGEEILINYGERWFSYRQHFASLDERRNKHGLVKVFSLVFVLLILSITFPIHSSTKNQKQASQDNNINIALGNKT